MLCFVDSDFRGRNAVEEAPELLAVPRLQGCGLSKSLSAVRLSGSGEIGQNNLDARVHAIFCRQRREGREPATSISTITSDHVEDGTGICLLFLPLRRHVGVGWPRRSPNINMGGAERICDTNSKTTNTITHGPLRPSRTTTTPARRPCPEETPQGQARRTVCRHEQDRGQHKPPPTRTPEPNPRRYAHIDDHEDPRRRGGSR